MTPKKSSVFSGNRPAEIFLSLTHFNKSNLYENMCFLFPKKTHAQTKKFPLANLSVRIDVFFTSNNKR